MTDASQRLSVLGIIAVSLVLTLFVRLWWLQVVTGSDLSEASTADRIRVVHEEAPRGRILDRQGDDVLVDNAEQAVVTIDPRTLRDVEAEDESFDRDEMFERLGAVLTQFGTPRTAGEIIAAVEDPAADPLRPIPVATGVSEDVEVYLLERNLQFPAVDVERESVRAYPYGSVAAHVLGYVGTANQDELDANADEQDKPYEPGDEIGKTGVEATYEEYLRGVPGQRTYEIDAQGDIVRLIEDQSYDPIPGYDLVLTIDVDLQAHVEQSLFDTVENTEAQRGSVVVEDPQDGTIWAMASNPSYSPADFVVGISAEDYAAMNRPESNFPLNNWAIQGQYAAASTFKLVTGWAGMQAGFRTPDEVWGDGGFYIAEGCSAEDESCRFNNDNETAHGSVNLARALTVSSDTYFYSLGDRFWLAREEIGDDAMQDYIREWGFGEQTGIGLPSEISGLVNTPALKAERHEQYPEAFPYGEWYTGDNINMAIGQGDMLATPLQLTNAYATFANGGTLREPQIASAVWRPNDEDPEGPPIVEENFIMNEDEELIVPIINEIDIPEDQYNAIRDGLLGVVNGGEGTAREAFEGFDPNFQVAGKTGTAQVASQDYGNALFASYGAVNNPFGPRFAVTAIIENTPLYGGEVAAPLVRTIYDVIALPSWPKAPTAESAFGAQPTDSAEPGTEEADG
jgi:penicillin-binding protein 2